MIVAILSRVPRRVLGAIGAALGALAFVLRIRRKVVDDNLRLAFPALTPAERRALAAANYRHAGRSVLEVFSAARLTRAAIDDLLGREPLSLLEQLVAEGHGVVVASAHLGSWELLAAAATERGLKVNIVTRKLRGKSNAALVEARAKAGIREIPPAGALKEGIAALRRGEVVVNLVDQNMLPKRGIFVKFFGEWACTTPAASLMAMRTGAPTLVALARSRPGGRTHLTLEGPFPVPTEGSVPSRVRAHTQLLVSVVERHIRAAPEEWFWLHRRWKTRPKVPPSEVRSMANV